MSRRVVLLGGTGVALGAAVGAAVATDTLDDALRAAGVEPKPEPDPGDRRLAAAARADADQLVRLAVAAKAPAPVVEALRAQGAALPGTASRSALSGDVATACRTAADARAAAVEKAVSVELAQVLAALSAGLDQCRLALVAAR